MQYSSQIHTGVIIETNKMHHCVQLQLQTMPFHVLFITSQWILPKNKSLMCIFINHVIPCLWTSWTIHADFTKVGKELACSTTDPSTNSTFHCSSPYLNDVSSFICHHDFTDLLACRINLFSPADKPRHKTIKLLNGNVIKVFSTPQQCLVF